MLPLQILEPSFRCARTLEPTISSHLNPRTLHCVAKPSTSLVRLIGPLEPIDSSCRYVALKSSNPRTPCCCTTTLPSKPIRSSHPNPTLLHCGVARTYSFAAVPLVDGLATQWRVRGFKCDEMVGLRDRAQRNDGSRILVRRSDRFQCEPMMFEGFNASGVRVRE